MGETKKREAASKKRVVVLRDFQDEAMENNLEYLQEQGVGDWEVIVPGLNVDLSQGQLLDVIQDEIRRADKVIALTGAPNANVAFEVGFAVGCGKRTVLCTRDPQDDSWQNPGPPFKGFDLVKVDGVTNLERAIEDTAGYKLDRELDSAGDTIFLCPPSGDGELYHLLKEDICPDWRCLESTDWNLDDLPKKLSRIARAVWVIAPYSGADRDGRENAAMAAAAGFALAKGVELYVLRPKTAREIALVSAIDHVCESNDVFREHLELLSGQRKPIESLSPLERYRAHLVRANTDLVPFFGHGGRTLDEVFVTLKIDWHSSAWRFSWPTNPESGDEAQLEEGLPRGSLTLEELLRLEPNETTSPIEVPVTGRWTVLGGPGSGKSTICRQLCWKLGQEEDGPIPILIGLNRFAREGRGQDPFDFIETELEGVEGSPGEGLAEDLRGLAEQPGRVWLLLDGLDEVDADLRPSLRTRIAELAAAHPNARFLLTARPEGYEAPHPSFRSTKLQDLETESQLDLLEKWMGEARGKDLFERIQGHRRLEDLARTPLLLTLLAKLELERAEHPGLQQGLPQTSAELYEQAIDLLLARGHAMEPKGVRDKIAARHLLRALSRRLQEDDAEEWDLATLYDRVDEATANRPDLQRKLERAWKTPEAFLEDIGLNSGILAPVHRTKGSWHFMHKSLCEFLVAEELLPEAKQDPTTAIELLKREDAARWGQVFVLLCSLLGREPEAQTQLLDALVTSDREIALRTLPDLEGLPAERAIGLLRRIENWDGDDLADLVIGLQRNGCAADEIRNAVLEDLGPNLDVEACAYHYFALEEAGIEVDREDFFQRCGRPVDPEFDLTWCRVPPQGESCRFRMGSEGPNAFDQEQPVHEVTVPAFELAATPVTAAQYSRFDPSRSAGSGVLPVVEVSWWEAWLFCRWIGARLPSESQWECACRGGTNTEYWSGDTEEDLARVGWYDKNSGIELHPVAQKEANPFGLFDMHGNVWEWCLDRGSPNYQESSAVHPDAYGRQRTPARSRVFRGGSFWNEARNARSAYRGIWHPEYRGHVLGFRPARVTTD